MSSSLQEKELENLVNQLNDGVFQILIDRFHGFQVPHIALPISDVESFSNGISPSVRNLLRHLCRTPNAIAIAERHGVYYSRNAAELRINTQQYQSFDSVELFASVSSYFRVTPTGNATIYLSFSLESEGSPLLPTTLPQIDPMLDVMDIEEASARLSHANDTVTALNTTISNLETEIAALLESEKRHEEQLNLVLENHQPPTRNVVIYQNSISDASRALVDGVHPLELDEFRN